MLCHAIAPARSLRRASNEIVRHSRLGSDTEVLVLYVQGLPASKVGWPSNEHAAALGVKGRAFPKAKRQSTADGFPHDWRWQGARGRWITDQVLSNVVLSHEKAERIRAGHLPAGQVPAVGTPAVRSAGSSPKEKKNRKKDIPLSISLDAYEGPAEGWEESDQHQEVEGERHERGEPWSWDPRDGFREDEKLDDGGQASEVDAEGQELGSVLVGETAWKHKALAEYGERLAFLVRRAETLAGKIERAGNPPGSHKVAGSWQGCFPGSGQ